MWKILLAALTETGKVFAQWRVASGVTFYMYVPATADLGTETLTVGSDVRFDELVSLDIRRTVQLGGLAATNNVEACREALEQVSFARVSEIADGIRVTTMTKPSLATLEAALAEFREKGKVEEARCERCASVVEVTRKTESVLTVECTCGLYTDRLRGL